MNVRKAQKHMQRATELLNQGQLGFGGPNKRTHPMETRSVNRQKKNKESVVEEDFECPVCLEYKPDKECVMICIQGHSICTSCRANYKQRGIDTCPLCRQSFLYDFVGNCPEMKEFFSDLTKNEVLITRDEGKWKVFHISDVSEKGKFICEIVNTGIEFFQLRTTQSQFITLRLHLSKLFFPTLNGKNNVIAQEFAKVVKLRKDKNVNVDMDMAVWTPNGKGQLYCVLTPAKVMYDQDQMPQEISKIIGTIELYNWKQDFYNSKRHFPEQVERAD